MKIVNTYQIMIIYDEKRPFIFAKKLQETLNEIEKRSNIAETHINSFQYGKDIMQTAIILEKTNLL